jgi:hypothetical protein
VALLRQMAARAATSVREAGGGIGLGRTLLGGTVGGIAGLATADSNTATGMFQNMLTGAALGAGIGFGVGHVGTMARGLIRAPQTIRAARAARAMGAGPLEALSFGRQAARGSSLLKNVTEAGRGALGTASAVGRAGLRTAGTVAPFVARHPLASLGIAGAGMGMYGLASVAERAGVPSSGFIPGMGATRNQIADMMFMDSTQGLVQGLHQGRHRGG